VSHISRFRVAKKSPAGDVVASPKCGICDTAVIINKYGDQTQAKEKKGKRNRMKRKVFRELFN